MKLLGAEFSIEVSARKDLEEFADRVVGFIRHPFFQRDDGIVCDRDVFGAHLGTALRNVAVADALSLGEFLGTVLRVERVHIQCRCVHEETRSDELVM